MTLTRTGMRSRARWTTRLALSVASLIAVLVMLAGLAVLGYGYFTSDRILIGLSVQHVNVGGLTRQQALAQLQETLAAQEMPYVRLEVGDQAWIYSTAALGGSLALDEAVEQAFLIGRSGIFREDLLTRARLLWRGYNIVPLFSLEPGLSLKPLRQIALQTATPPRSARMWVAGLDVNNDDARAGRDLDIPAAQTAIRSAVTAALGSSGWSESARWRVLLANEPPVAGHLAADPIPVTLSLIDLNPAIADITAAYERADAVLSGPVELYFDDPAGAAAAETGRTTWAIDRAMLAGWLVLNAAGMQETGAEATLDLEALQSYIAELARQIDRPARQGRYDYDAATATLTVREPEQYGRSLDQEQAVALLERACLSATDRTVNLPVTISEPEVTEAQLSALLPLELISTGETGFSGSTAARLHNIVVAAGQFDGVAVAAQSRFSFVDHLGLVTIATGYAEGWVIMGNETVLGPGGGVCQVGTTFFRAAFWGGYPIVERTPHAYRVSWYEPPVGLDAAIYSPTVDVKFDNDQDTPILIQTEVDQSAAKLYVRFYGRAPDRTVTIEGPTLTDPVPAGDPIIETDPSLGPGVRVQVESAHDGITATLYRVIESGGVTIAREIYVSKYAPWPARYREGPTQ